MYQSVTSRLPSLPDDSGEIILRTNVSVKRGARASAVEIECLSILWRGEADAGPKRELLCAFTGAVWRDARALRVALDELEALAAVVTVKPRMP
jgi:hypothetical protein